MVNSMRWFPEAKASRSPAGTGELVPCGIGPMVRLEAAHQGSCVTMEPSCPVANASCLAHRAGAAVGLWTARRFGLHDGPDPLACPGRQATLALSRNGDQVLRAAVFASHLCRLVAWHQVGALGLLPSGLVTKVPWYQATDRAICQGHSFERFHGNACKMVASDPAIKPYKTHMNLGIYSATQLVPRLAWQQATRVARDAWTKSSRSLSGEGTELPSWIDRMQP